MASREGLEPPQTVLETVVLPLHHPDIKYSMNITFTPASKILYFADVQDPPAAWSHMHQELADLDWKHEPATGGQDQWAVQCRAPQCAPYTTALHQFGQQFGAEFKQRLLTLLFDNPEFMMNWCMPDRKYFDRITKLICNWTATPARYDHHPWHLDSRNQVAFGMIYFTKQDNPLHSTWFDTGLYGHLLRVPSGPGQGWLVVNTDQARHCGMNNTDSLRYSFKFSLDLLTKEI